MEILKKEFVNINKNYLESLDSLLTIIEKNLDIISICSTIVVSNKIHNYLDDIYLFRPCIDHHDAQLSFNNKMFIGNMTKIVQVDGTLHIGHINNKPVYVDYETSSNKIIFYK